LYRECVLQALRKVVIISKCPRDVVLIFQLNNLRLNSQYFIRDIRHIVVRKRNALLLAFPQSLQVFLEAIQQPLDVRNFRIQRKNERFGFLKLVSGL